MPEVIAGDVVRLSLFCPECEAEYDTLASTEGVTEVECVFCGQRYRVSVTVEKVNEAG